MWNRPAKVFDKFTGIFFYLIPHCGKLGHNFLFCTRHLSRIGEILMKFLGLSREERASFFGIVTNGYHIVKVNAPVFLYVIGSMPRNIDTIFFHSSNSAGIYAMRFYPRAVYLRFPFGKMPKIAFRYLTAATIAGAKH